MWFHGLTLESFARGKFVTWLKEKKTLVGKIITIGLYYMGFPEFGQSVMKRVSKRGIYKVLGDNGITAYNMSRLN